MPVLQILTEDQYKIFMCPDAVIVAKNKDVILSSFTDF